MNPVELDTAVLDAEADRILAESAIAEGATAPGGATLDATALGQGSWTEVTPGLVAAADVLLLPQWNLREDEKTQLADALGGVLDQLFPGGMSDARWAPYLRLVAVSVAITVTHRDPITGKFPPLGPMKLADRSDAAAADSAANRKAA